MEFLNNEYALAGFFSATTVSVYHFQDVAMAFVLGLVGACGGWVFKLVKDKLTK